MPGATRGPSKEVFEERRALRSSVTLGESSLPSQAVSWSPVRKESFTTYDSGMRRWLQLKIESDGRYQEASNRDPNVASWASGELVSCRCADTSWCARRTHTHVDGHKISDGNKASPATTIASLDCGQGRHNRQRKLSLSLLLIYYHGMISSSLTYIN